MSDQKYADLGKVPLTIMTERESAKGNRYFSGLLGNATLLMFRSEDDDSEYGAGWRLVIQERAGKGQQRSRKREEAPRQAPVSASQEYHRPPQERPFDDEWHG